eukprot:TRINITY_DN79770_c0_g1_i1.p1 TRINITY_DN79770_c0_g1~~TRINITY_DN79770_c0_g1_i1.p1  ORF type:complete len:264 (-),score=26.30 TRINITY_DN79770_c0_g1_i1:75-803(-)
MYPTLLRQTRQRGEDPKVVGQENRCTPTTARKESERISLRLPESPEQEFFGKTLSGGRLCRPLAPRGRKVSFFVNLLADAQSTVSDDSDVDELIERSTSKKRSYVKTPVGPIRLSSVATCKERGKATLEDVDAQFVFAQTVMPSGIRSRIFVKMPAGDLVALDTDLAQSIASLKRQLRSMYRTEFGAGSDSCILRFRGEQLPDYLTLKECRVELGSVVHALNMKIRAPPCTGATAFRQRAYH